MAFLALLVWIEDDVISVKRRRMSGAKTRSEMNRTRVKAHSNHKSSFSLKKQAAQNKFIRKVFTISVNYHYAIGISKTNKRSPFEAQLASNLALL